jgi:hypothetical protein
MADYAALIKAGADLYGSYKGAQAANRGADLEAQLARETIAQQKERDFNEAAVAREAEGRAGQRSAWDLLNRASYVKNAPTNLNTTNLSPYSRAIAGPSAEARQGATSLEAETLKRLAGGNPLAMPTPIAPASPVVPPDSTSVPYSLNPMNANGVDERTFQTLYTQNKDAIDAYVRAHPKGKDPREAAFAAVTGQPWPDGRGVNSAGQMTKDRTVKSVMGKYVVPIAAAAVTGGAALPYMKSYLDAVNKPAR